MSAPKMTAKDVLRLLAALLLSPLLKASPMCGSWLTRRAGWNCQRLADNYQLYHKTSNGTMQLGLDVWPTAVNELTQIDWIGIGISEAGGMPGADIAVLVRNRTDPRGWSVWDMFSNDFVRPVMDARQDKVLVAVQERSSDGRILACISFPMVSCDTTQDRPIRPGLHSYVIFAFGEGMFSYHGSRNRGDATVLLAPSNVSTKSNNTSGGKAPSTNGTASTPNSTTPNSTQPSNATLPATPPATPEDRSTVSVLMPSISIPTDDTDPYICADFELPGSLERPYHVIDFTTIVNTTAGPGQVRYVHHIVLYNCTTRPATFGRGPYECQGTPVNCSTFVLVATMANNTVTLPPEAGFRIGVGAMRYVVLQVHYNNVNLDSGLIDRSGFRLTYTSRLRKHDMGVIALGMTGFQIPARSRWSTGPNICPPGCTRRLRQPVTLVSNLLHMHELGVSMSTQHLRQVTSANGTAQWVELEPTGLRQYFSFGYQPFMDVPPQTSVLMPGDALVTTCNYSNPHSYPVSFGARTAEEMCYTFMAYYPLSELTYCTEMPGLRSSGLALCEGVEDGPLVGQLYRINRLSSAAQGRLVDTLMERSILVPREESMLTLARPFTPTLPDTCPKKT